MKYISTRGNSTPIGFNQAIIEGLAPDGGLYVPKEWPKFNDITLKAIKDLPYFEVAALVLKAFAGDDIDIEIARKICKSAYGEQGHHDEIVPARKIDENLYLLELFHGYHTPDDRVQYFDVPYYEKLAKLSFATVATLAVPVESGLALREERVAGNALYAFPNPTAEDASVWIERPSPKRARIALLDALGREVSVLHDGPLAAGRHGFNVPLAAQPPGGYLVRAVVEGSPSQSVRVVRMP